MASTTHPPAEAKRAKRLVQTGSGSGGPGGVPPTRGWGGGDSGGDSYHAGQRYKLAVWVGIAGIVMFFAAISSAMVVTSAREDWQRLELPAILWVSTGLLLISSLTFEFAKRSVRQKGAPGARRWITITSLLGVGFLAAQLAGWSQLIEQGVAMAGQPSGAFFYLLTAAHGLHLLGGIIVLGYVTTRASLMRPWPRTIAVVEASALYWHFMDALWLYILGLLVWLG